jgi:hypothetical protein
MDYEDFVRLVEKMRKAQKDYDEVRLLSIMHKKHRLEGDVDKAILLFKSCQQNELL